MFGGGASSELRGCSPVNLFLCGTSPGKQMGRRLAADFLPVFLRIELPSRNPVVWMFRFRLSLDFFFSLFFATARVP